MSINKSSPEYKKGYQAGYSASKLTSYWVIRNGEWYCKYCGTLHNQGHDNYCCKCGAKMSEEAELDEDN